VDFSIMSFRINLLLGLTLGLASPFTRADIATGDAFPPLSGLASLSGGDVPALAGKVVLIDFWASWCAPCKASFSVMAKLHAAYEARGLQIVAVGIDEKPALATAFWKKMAPPFPGLHDREQTLVSKVGVPTMPTSYLLDRTGKVRFRHEGFRGDASERELRQHIEALLAEKSGQ
jgi:thiol-disulfide isomerase/thioredoxin